ncbi:MAG TPA: Asp-tRNA(Asn)/Glu-tRNA(Gln) amidotransferase subunit GatB [Firmicutes bacterium]|nr:Asp-tRNA(Asn)/Glu-tRNA(Gln) amidotransferase subunit GatB [Bacillota bacterium]
MSSNLSGSSDLIGSGNLSGSGNLRSSINTSARESEGHREYEEYEVIIGLEVHAELLTDSKIFCGCSTKFGAAPNSHVCPICLGMPGVLPVVNRKAVEFAIRTGLALNCEIAEFSKFDRKNYFYPDLPKNYQISQYDLPLCRNGYIDIPADTSVLSGGPDDSPGGRPGEKGSCTGAGIQAGRGPVRRIRIKRVHLEEEAGKSIHEGQNIVESSFSLEDYNRAGIPLMEIVSEPDIRSPREAYVYLSTLRAILQYIGVSDCKMEEGSLRCDANISVRPRGSTRYGAQTELKNLNSFRAVEKGLAFEAARQIDALRRGERVVRETRHWDEARGITVPMRSKEEAHDYRYFPEPDLVPMVIEREWVERIREELPELPGARKERLMKEYGLPEYDAGLITESRAMADFFEACARNYRDPKIVSNWVMGELSRLLNESGKDISEVPVTPGGLADMLKLIDEGVISGKIAKAVFEEMFSTGKAAREIVKEKGLVQIADEGQLLNIIDQVIAENPGPVADVAAGKDKAITFLVGQVMRKTQGRANPQLATRLLRERLQEGR